jgi:tRNA (mo5U34)-methyltransferase
MVLKRTSGQCGTELPWAVSPPTVGWFHSIDFGNGPVTQGFATAEALSKRLVSLGLEESIAGATFLDIASWDGFYAFQAESLGASRVLATDYFCWGHGGWGTKGGFLLAREIIDSKVEDKDIEVNDLSPETVGIWNIVLFSGIFYHMRDPIKALSAAASVTKNRLIVETHVDHDDIERPIMRYVPRVPGDATSNYWRPNTTMLVTLLRELGFSRIDHKVDIDPDDSTHQFFNAYR